MLKLGIFLIGISLILVIIAFNVYKTFKDYLQLLEQRNRILKPVFKKLPLFVIFSLCCLLHSIFAFIIIVIIIRITGLTYEYVLTLTDYAFLIITLPIASALLFLVIDDILSYLFFE